jgi:hypothetical protein
MTDHTPESARIPALDTLRDGFVEVARGEARRSARRRTRQLAAGLAAVALLATVAAVVATDEPDGSAVAEMADELIELQHGVGLVPHGPQYRTLDGLVADSQLVVAGTVWEVRPGGEVVDIDPEYPTRFVDAVIQVDEVLKGAPTRDRVTVRTLESAYAPAPGGSGGPDLEWRKRGERVVAFLASSPDGGPALVPTSYSQSLYRLKRDNVVPLAGQGPERRPVPSMPLELLRAAVQAASER